MVEALRVSQNASDMMDEAFSSLLRINRTDSRCLDIVHRLGRITAGDLARMSGLTTGAVTTVVDRLEQAGYLRRIRDTEDRRKVFLEATERANRLAEAVYGQISEVGQRRMGDMNIEDIIRVTRFLHINAHINKSLSDALREVCAAENDEDDPLKVAKAFATHMRSHSDTVDKGVDDIICGKTPE
ncbi:MarR family transcriptional regulator [Flavimaribacter sediminis]|nr:MarR family transcriptional regulator [Flavimaribacter sediminis]